jgi:hypothetical protein
VQETVVIEFHRFIGFTDIALVIRLVMLNFLLTLTTPSCVIVTKQNS